MTWGRDEEQEAYGALNSRRQMLMSHAFAAGMCHGVTEGFGRKRRTTYADDTVTLTGYL